MLSEVIKLAEEISKLSPVAVQGTKHNLVYSRDHTVQEGLDHIVRFFYFIFKFIDKKMCRILQSIYNRNNKKIIKLTILISGYLECINVAK